MRPKIVFTIIFSFLLVNFLWAQSIKQTYDFANKQFLAKDYIQAVTEFQRVAFFDTDITYKDVFQKIGDSFFALEDYNRARENYDIASRIFTNDSIIAEIIFKKANCLFKQQNYIFALNELLVIPEPSSLYLQNKYSLYLAIAYFGMEQYQVAFTYFNKVVSQDAIHLLTGISDDFEKFRRRFRPGKIQTMSMLMLGLGQIYTGNIGSGLNSMALIGGIAVATVYIWQVYGFVDALLSTGSWYYRYYSGGYQNAKILAIEKIEHKKEEVYESVLDVVKNNVVMKR
jgi:tetratricopeptide (TPR) repeat protein